MDLTENENEKLKRLKYLFRVAGKTDVIKKLISNWSIKDIKETEQEIRAKELVIKYLQDKNIAYDSLFIGEEGIVYKIKYN